MNKINVRKEIEELKKTLNELNIQKEQWFTTKESLSQEIKKLIKTIRGIKSSKYKSNETIQLLKEQRDRYNKQTQEMIAKFKVLNNKKKKILKIRKIDFDPSKLLENISSIETTVETEALSFEKEQQLMKRIRDLRKKMKDAEGVQDLFKKLKELSEKIDESKNKSEEFHKKIQEEYRINKEGYSKFMGMTHQINDLNKKQEEAFKKFIDSKNQFSKINKDLKSKLKEAGQFIKQQHIRRQHKDILALEQKAREVEAKIKEKKKLTTEDILVLQKNNK